MEIRWHGHACFTVSSSGYSIVLDPYADGMLEGYPPLRLRADRVLCSHSHNDHAFTQAVTLTNDDKPCPFRIQRIDSWHDTSWGELRGANIIHVLEAEGLRIVHMGDIGCPLNAEQISSLSEPDALLLPVGGFYTIDAAEAKEMAEQLKARVIVPMHYRGDGFGLRPIGTLEAFTALFEPEFVRYYDSDTLEITKDMDRQVAVLKRPTL